MTTLAQVWSSVGRPTVAVLGDIMLDRYTFGEVARISPEAPVPVLRVTAEEERLGGAGSVVADLRALEAPVRMVGLIGRDADGARVMELARGLGVDTSGVLAVAARRTTVKNRHVARGGPYGQQVLRVDREDDATLDEGTAAALAKAAEGALAGAKVLLLSDYAKGVLSPPVIAAVLKMAAEKGVPVVVDPKGSEFARYRGATVLTPNRREAFEATGVMPKDPDSIRRAARALLDITGAKAAVITLDRDGMALLTDEGTELLAPADARDVFDVTGAGDMVVAVLALCVGAGVPLVQAVPVANAAGGLEVARLGSVPLNRVEILAALGGGSMHGKVMTLDQARAVVSSRQAGKDKVVFTNGCFDVVHAGHTRFLARARELGDMLVVGLNDDASVQRLKGENRPIMALEDRAEMLASLECVDMVVPFSQDTPLEIITALTPNVLVKGEDWKEKGVVGREVVEGGGGKVVLLKLAPGRSTTGVVERIKHLLAK